MQGYNIAFIVRPEQLKTFDNNFTRRDRYDRLGDQRNAEQACNFSSEESGGSVSELIVFVREKKMVGIIQ